LRAEFVVKAGEEIFKEVGGFACKEESVGELVAAFGVAGGVVFTGKGDGAAGFGAVGAGGRAAFVGDIHVYGLLCGEFCWDGDQIIAEFVEWRQLRSRRVGGIWEYFRVDE
jgi:hypothetical protein